MTGGALYGLGVFLASFSDQGLVWLYLTYGLIGGIGLGFGYIVPVAVLVKWFPDRRGLITGIAVGGFGIGALVTAPLANRLIQANGVLRTFAYLGIAYFVITVIGGSFMKNPPPGWKPAGWSPKAAQARQRVASDFTLANALKTWQWWALWLLLFLNVLAGISLISQEAPIFQELAGVSAAVAAGMVGVASIGNAFGRIGWSWLSDVVTRRGAFSMMFGLQAAIFAVYPNLHSAFNVGLATFVVLMCYGGGFGIMPAFCADYFGSTKIGPIYGLMLTAWGFASAFGPILFARMREANHDYREGLHMIAIVLAVATFLPIVVRPPRTD
jgi:OFA family oxalate/formate antiporter-like MFS transporter